MLPPDSGDEVPVGEAVREVCFALARTLGPCFWEDVGCAGR